MSRRIIKSVSQRLPLRDRLLLYSHLDEMGCWLWQGTSFQNTGYGQVTHERRIYSAHRLSMHVFRNFDLSSSELILHKCDVKKCINPDHLYVGTRIDNTRDALKRRRYPKGSNHSQSKLTEDEVAIILMMLRSGRSYGSIAAHFDVDSSLIGLIKRKKIWTHVKEPV